MGPYAIQHTSVDALPRGRAADHHFKQVVGDLEDELAGKLGFPLAITWEWAAIQKGPKRQEVRAALRRWLTQDAPKLPKGYHRITNAPGVPFPFEVWKEGRIKYDGVRFARIDPKDTTFSTRLRDQIAGADHDKLTVLGRYQAEGNTTILLLESADIAFMSVHKMVEALEAAFPIRPEELDEVWFLHHVASPTVNVHDLRGGGFWLFDRDARKVTAHNPDGPRLAWPA